MSSGGGQQSTTTTTKVELSPEQRKILGLAMPNLEKFAATPASSVIPPFSGVAGFDPLQMQGQEAVLQAAPYQAGTLRAAGGGNEFLSSGAVLDPRTNPGLQGAISAATRPLTEDLLAKALPALRSGAEGAGQYGSSRQGIGEGMAYRDTGRLVTDATAKVVNPAYQAGLDAMVKAQGLAPSIAGSYSLPGATMSGVGDVRQALAQALLGEQTQRYGTEAMWPLLMGQQYAGIMAGLPGAGTTATSTGPAPQSNSLMQALGLGAAGVSAFGSIAPYLPFLAASDRRTKEIIRRLKRWFRGIPLYEFRYLGETLSRIGVMADEVPAYARVRVNGIDFVDYGAL